LVTYYERNLMNTFEKTTLLLSILGSVLLIVGCSDARIASHNLAKAAEQFEISRRIVFFNGITDTYLLSLEGRCSLEAQTTQRQLEVTCKTGADSYKKHHLGLSDNVSYFSEQTGYSDVSAYHYRVIFKPQALLPDIDFRGDIGESGRAAAPDNDD
jgi:hypothetical protein